MQRRNQGVKKMQKSRGPLAKGIGIGMAVGGMAGLVGSSLMSRPAKRQTKKNITKAMRTIGDMMDSIQYMLK